MDWLRLAAPAAPFPALSSCRTAAVLGDGVLNARVTAELAGLGVVLTEADAMTADLVVLTHALGDGAVGRAFGDLTILAARAVSPALVVSVARDTADAAGVAGLVKTAALEWGAAWKCVTIQDGVDPVLAVASELAGGGIDREVRLGRDREVRIRVHDALTCAPRALPDGTWVISGGARGVTAACSLALAEAGARRIALLGRTRLEEEPDVCRGHDSEAALKRALIAHAGAAPDLRAIGRRVSAILAQREIRATLAAIAAAGAQVRYEAVDVAAAADVQRTVAAVRQDWGPIRGLVHAAGVLADKRLGEKTLEQFASVLRAKAGGARALLDACAEDPLEQLCFFSSVAAHAGNPGQSDYAAANAILDRLALDEQERRGAACHVVSIAWGPWAGGMVTESLARHFVSRGVGLIPLRAGARALVDELRSGTSAQVIIGCGLDQADGHQPELVRFSTHGLPGLRDHRVGGSVVLPMTLALDTLLGAGRRALGAHCEARDLRLLQGVVFAGDEVELEMRAEPSGDGGLAVALHHRSGRPAYRVNVAAAGGQLPPVPALPIASGNLPESCRHPYAAALFHGPALQVIREVLSCDDEAISGRLGTAAALGWPGAWQIDPAALDGALQLLRLWGFVQDGRVSLPTAIGRCRVWAPWPASPDVICVVHCRRDGAHRLSGDALFHDPASGRPLVSLDGIVMHIHAG